MPPPIYGYFHYTIKGKAENLAEVRVGASIEFIGLHDIIFSVFLGREISGIPRAL
jgi:hypothetical protein